jgi:hypothetical protein
VAKVITTQDGIRVRFTAVQRLHIAYFHPEVLVDEKKIGRTLRRPEFIALGSTDDTRIYYRFFKSTPVGSKFLAVVVKRLDGEGFIVTSYFTERVKRTRLVWGEASN